MPRNRLRLVAFLVVMASFAFYYFASPKVEVDAAVRPYIERCLDLIIERNYKLVYDTYLEQRSLPRRRSWRFDQR